MLWKNYELIDGEYVDSPFPEEFLEEYDMRPGGLLVKSRNYDYSILVADTWSVDEKEALLFLGGEPFPIYRLTADEMEIGGTKAYDVETAPPAASTVLVKLTPPNCWASGNSFTAMKSRTSSG